jgi:hypothetical protein
MHKFFLKELSEEDLKLLGEEKSGDEHIFEVEAFLISSAKGYLWETKLYGP